MTYHIIIEPAAAIQLPMRTIIIHSAQQHNFIIATNPSSLLLFLKTVHLFHPKIISYVPILNIEQSLYYYMSKFQSLAIHATTSNPQNHSNRNLTSFNSFTFVPYDWFAQFISTSILMSTDMACQNIFFSEILKTERREITEIEQRCRPVYYQIYACLSILLFVRLWQGVVL